MSFVKNSCFLFGFGRRILTLCIHFPRWLLGSCVRGLRDDQDTFSRSEDCDKRRVTVFVLTMVFGLAAAAVSRSDAGQAQSLSPNFNVTTEPSKCAGRLSAFIGELDQLLASHPTSTDPISDLLHKYHPFEKCELAQAVKIMKRSRFLGSVSEDRDAYIFGFSSASISGGHGFDVQISIEKATGNSILPFVITHGFL
jgi:hypothetical protein